ncbi:MAG: hypothetical protein ABJC74_05120, partial [Gemmatimonadota bacterium]
TTLPHFGVYANFLYYLFPLAWSALYLAGHRRTALTGFIVNFFLLVSTGQKAPMVYILMMWMLAGALVAGRAPYRRWLVVGGVTIAGLLMLIIMQNQLAVQALDSSAISIAIEALRRRVLYGGTQALLDYVRFFPDQFSHYYFARPDIPADQLVFAFGHPVSDVIGSANTVSLGNLWAAFGNVWVVGGMMLLICLGLFIGDLLLLGAVRTPLSAAIYLLYCRTALVLVISDWWTGLSGFVIISGATAGAFFLFEALARGVAEGRLAVRGRPIAIAASILTFLYFAQGQVRGWFH